MIERVAEVVGQITEALGAHASETASGWDLGLLEPSLDAAVLHVSAQDLEALLNKLDRMDRSVDLTLSSPVSREILVREESAYPIPGRFRDDLCLEDSDNGLTYRLGRLPDYFILFLLDLVAQEGRLPDLVPPFLFRRFLDRQTLPDEDRDVFGILRRAFGRFLTLKVEAAKPRQANELAKFADAFLFELGYNMDIAVVPERNVEALLRRGRLARVRRAVRREIDPPRRHYDTDLIHHYQLGVAGENPFIAFLSYYHVAEHFFEAVFRDDLVHRVRETITGPDFSYRRKKDIDRLIRDISQSLRVRDERVTFSEQEALRLTIERYVRIDRVSAQIQDLDSSLAQYYASNKVTFSGGNVVDLLEDNHSEVVRQLAARIYKTRNAVVHSKESDTGRYLPFRDDRHLAREVPLMRFVAEEIIIGTSGLAT